MLRRVQARNFRCLRDVNVALDGSIHILVGPNGSGKSALLDVVSFFRDSLTNGLETAVTIRTSNFQDLVWARPKDNMSFQLALEFDVFGALDAFRTAEPNPFSVVKFMLEACELDDKGLTGRIWVDLLNEQDSPTPGLVFEPAGYNLVQMEFGPETPIRGRFIYNKGSERVARDIDSFLDSSVRTLFLDSKRLRRASPPRPRSNQMTPVGSNLPWAVQRLRNENGERFNDWLEHVRTAIRGLREIRVVEREDDRHAYLMIRYANGVNVPSWAVSDGTLRLLALTLIAYLPDSGCIYLLEEPENGIHPLAVETVYQSLSSIWDSQVLVASHSPELLMCAEPKDVLCFSIDEDGAAQIVRGDRHPRLAHWRSAADVDLLFASEILG